MSDTKHEEVKTALVAESQTEGKEKVDDTYNLSDDDNCKEQDEETGVCATMEPCTLPWPGDRKPQIEQDDDGIGSEKCTSEPEDVDTGISRGSQDISEKQSQGEEGGIGNKSKWRESMPEGERWRSDEIQQEGDKGGGSLADDEDEGDDDDDDEDGEVAWKAEKGVPGFSPQVTIVRMSSKELQGEQERPLFEERDVYKEPYPGVGSAQMYHEWPQQDDKIYLCDGVCGERLKLTLSTVVGALLFPLLVWGGYELLPFDSPVLNSAPLRVVYTLRCSMFAMIPILLGVLVQGVARLRYSSLRPLYAGREEHRLVAVHGHFVSESVGLFLFYFLQLAVMATYISQDLVKLVPLLTIIFAFGRLIYWLCLSLRSSIRGFGFSFSFAPVLVMLGVNLYYICSSMGQGAVFDVEPPPTAAPPRQRWFG